jgi:hypothetical protein
MPIYDDQMLREALAKVESELDHYLKLTIDILRKSFPSDTSYLNFMIKVHGPMHGELELAYGFAEGCYQTSPDVTGKYVHVALLEFLRRKGYEADYSVQTIPTLLSPPSEDDSDIPF